MHFDAANAKRVRPYHERSHRTSDSPATDTLEVCPICLRNVVGSDEGAIQKQGGTCPGIDAEFSSNPVKACLDDGNVADAGKRDGFSRPGISEIARVIKRQFPALVIVANHIVLEEFQSQKTVHRNFSENIA